MRIDLHTHTVWSDGVLTPAELLARAREKLLTHIAICDHDTIAAYDALEPADVPAGLTIVPGVEISAVLADIEVHILGLGIDLANDRLRRTIANLLDHRRTRLAGMFDKLVRIGVFAGRDEVAIAELREQTVDRPHLQPRNDIGPAACRMHLVGALRDLGLVSTIQEAFDRYIGPKKGAYVPYYRYDGAEAIAMIREAGGVPVLAHPGVYRDRWAPAMRAAAEAGIAGVELSHPRQDRNWRQRIRKLARELDLTLFSGGSDFHSTATPLGHRFGNCVLDDEHWPALRSEMRCPAFEPVATPVD